MRQYKYQNILAPEDVLQAGGLGTSGQHQAIGKVIEWDPLDDAMKSLQVSGARQDQDMKQQKFNMLQRLMKGLPGFGGSGGGNSSFRMNGPNIPAPQYINAGPVWTQNQINMKANQGRNELLNQASQQSTMFTQDLANRGFSPFSPFAGFNQQANMMRANSGAMRNETDLNFNAAKANSDARLQAAGINAGIQGDYMRSLLGQQQLSSENYWKGQGMQNQQQEALLSMIRGLF